ncbi:hypothetical protein [Pseudaeromonas pectinilytica]
MAKIEVRINDIDDINVTSKTRDDGPAIKQAIFRASVFSPSQTWEVRVSPDLLEAGVLEWLKTKLDQKLFLPIEDHEGNYPDGKTGQIKLFRFYRLDPCVLRWMDADGFTLGPKTSVQPSSSAAAAKNEPEVFGGKK